jgi:hypothetical protein
LAKRADSKGSYKRWSASPRQEVDQLLRSRSAGHLNQQKGVAVRRTLILVSVFAAAALVTTGALAARSYQAKSFPTVYKINEGIPSKGKNGTLVLKGTLQASDGTQGTFTQIFKEKRVAGRAVRCGGKTYHGPFTENLKNPGHGTFSIVGWGNATFKIARTVAVYPTAGVGSSPPLCALDTGTYRFIAGRLKGKHGTYTSPLDKLVLH